MAGDREKPHKIADEFDLEQFKVLARSPGLVRAAQQLAAAQGKTFEELVQEATDIVRKKFGVPH